MSASAGVLLLDPVTASVPAARALVRKVLDPCESDVVDSAELCMSELVTNGVVHARTRVEVRVELLGERVRLEIRDFSTAVPRHIIHSNHAATGRGLDLVRMLAREWGITLVEDGGKVVWCELDAAPAEPLGGDDVDTLLAAWPDDLADAPAEPSTGPSSAPSLGITATLLDYPVRLGLRHREHTDALLRECLLLHQAAVEGQTSAPGQLVELAATMTERYSDLVLQPERLKQQALERGDLVVDLEYPLPPETSHVLLAWRDVFTALDAHADNHQLLTLTTPPDVARLRAWILDEFLAQSAGQAPTPWSGPLL